MVSWKVPPVLILTTSLDPLT